ncbi:hypothetical protein [Flavobacterium sp.]|uniref:hypothetical protein n=1 Tax=Flavobacterium sp. TaxID=239 RepID=UPI003751CE3D
MANSSNAYATERPITTSITDWVAKQAGMDLAYKQEKRLADAEKERIKNRDIEKAEKAFKNSELKYSLTKYSNHDEPLIAFIDGQGGLTEQNLEISKQLEKTPNDVKLRVKQNNLKNSIKRIDNLRKGIIGQTDVLNKGLSAEGGLSPYLNSAIAQDYNKMVGEIRYDYILDDNGNVGVKRKDFVDKNEDGIADTFTLEDLNDPTKMGVFKPRFSSKDWSLDAKKRYGTLDEKGSDPKNPYITNESKGFNTNNKTLLDDEVNQMFGQNYANMTDTAKSFIADELKLDPKTYDEKSFLNLKENYKNSFIGSYPQTKNTTLERVDQNQDQKRADDKKKDGIKNTLERDKLALNERKRLDNLANDKAKNAIARAKLGQGTVVDDTPLDISGTKVNSTQKGNEVVNGKAVLRNGSVNFALQGDGLKRVVGEGDKAIIEDANLISYNKKTGVLTVRAERINGFDDESKKNVKPETVYYGSNGEGSKLWEFFQKRKDNDGNYYKDLPQVIEKYKSIAESETKKQNTTKKYSSTQENAINVALKSNPGYTRQEIIQALKIQ